MYYYKAIDLDKGIFAKWKVAEESAARIAVGWVLKQYCRPECPANSGLSYRNFSPGKGLDFATIGYNVPGYYEEADPKIYLYTHDFQTQAADAKSEVVSTVWGGEPLYYVPKPTEVQTARKIPLLEVAEYRIYLEIFPPNYKVGELGGDAIKVLWGELHNGETTRRALGVPQYQKRDAKLVGGFLESKREGAIFVRFTPLGITPLSECSGWPTAEQVPVKSLFQFSYPQIQLAADLKFIRVDQLPWGGDFKGVLFYNMSGIHIRFLDKTPLCHMQFWTAG